MFPVPGPVRHPMTGSYHRNHSYVRVARKPKSLYDLLAALPGDLKVKIVISVMDLCKNRKERISELKRCTWCEVDHLRGHKLFPRSTLNNMEKLESRFAWLQGS